LEIEGFLGDRSIKSFQVGFEKENRTSFFLSIEVVKSIGKIEEGLSGKTKVQMRARLKGEKGLKVRLLIGLPN